ncbi:hypothetical protein QWZ03_14880 [Chitinimonas viridis]|uniref:Uncharacterized protein n=1 Tax=Chitinimonas viridis TaxID=664880 RepID=A0ABT8B8C3_9NEIS|nr:hypothetical protein [Chitinimonas viridis]MDN3578050.1 hypothetical protein [Chitinimonas viridis]
MALEIDSNPYQLIEESNLLPYGSAQKADLLDRAVVLADKSGSVRTQFDARMARLFCATFGGEPQLMLALFAWCQSTADKRPDIINPSELLWSAKFVLIKLPKYARITQQQIDSIQHDMVRRYEAHGASLRGVYTSLMQAALSQGRVPEARVFWDKAMKLPRDNYADCRACEVSNSLSLLASEHRYEELLSTAKPILAGQLRCAEVPHFAYPSVLQAMHGLEQQEDTRPLSNKGYRLIQSNAKFIGCVATLIELLVLDDELIRAAQLVTRHLPWLQATTLDTERLHYTHALHRLLLAIWAKPIRAAQWRQQLFAALEEIYGAGAGQDDDKARLEWLLQQTTTAGLAIADALDQRNANRYYREHWNLATY